MTIQRPVGPLFEESREAFTFLCRRCGASWQRAYDVRRHFDGSGDEFRCYSLNGQACPPPSDQTCPDCGGLRVARLPTSG